MNKASTGASVALFIVLFLLADNSLAQDGLCIMGVGNCPQGVTNTQNPTTNSPTVTNSQGSVDPGNHTVHVIDPLIAAEIMAAKQNNERYLLKLQEYYDPNTGMLCEERAWVGGNYSGGPSAVVVQVGPSARICHDPRQPIWSAKDVNDTERAIDSWSSEIFRWEKYEQSLAIYISQNIYNPQAVANAQAEIHRSRAWTQYYRNEITQIG